MPFGWKGNLNQMQKVALVFEHIEWTMKHPDQKSLVKMMPTETCMLTIL
mgnify:CR=1 FL=1